MQAFDELRAKAKEKRDTAIALARGDYDATLESIASLEKDLLGEGNTPRAKKSRTTGAIILEVIPPDSEFTTAELLAALEQRDPDRKWSKQWIDANLRLLRKRGLIRRLKRDGNRPSIYCKADAPVPMRPFEGLRLKDVAAQLLGQRAMTLTELVVALGESGYQTTMTKKKLHDKLSAVLPHDERFKREGDQWSTC